MIPNFNKMFNIKIKRIIIAICILVVIVVTVWGFWIWSKASRVSSSGGAGASPSAIPSLPAVRPAAPLGAVAAPDAKGEVAQAGIEAFSRSFVERYGSFSSQSIYENLEDLYRFMTARFRKESEAIVSAARAKSAGTMPQYSGVTTRVMSVKKITVSGQSAELIIATQRENSGTKSGIVYQDIELTLSKVGGQWKVEGAGWK